MPRPKLPEGEGKRHPLNLRTTIELRSRLDAAAEGSGRSLAQEVEVRLERSFELEALTKHTPTLAFLQALALTIERIQTVRKNEWQEDAPTAALCRVAIDSVTDLLMQDDETLPNAEVLKSVRLLAVSQGVAAMNRHPDAFVNYATVEPTGTMGELMQALVDGQVGKAGRRV